MEYSPISTVLNTPELLWYMLLKAEYEDVIEYCRSYVQAEQICRQNAFWIQKAQKDFGIPSNEFINTTLSSSQRYLQLLTEEGGIAIGSEKYLGLVDFAARAIQQNRDDLYQYALDLGFNHWRTALKEYAAKGNKQLVDYYLTLTPNYQIAAQGALKGGHLELFNYIISLAPIDYQWDYMWLAFNALTGGYVDLFDYVRSLAPLNYNWSWNFLAGAVAGNKELFNYVISLVPNYPWDWQHLISRTLYNENKEMFDYIKSLVPNYQWNWNLLAGAAPNLAFFNYIISLAPLNYGWNYNQLLETAIDYSVSKWNKSKKMLDYIRSLAPEGYQWNWNLLVTHAIKTMEKDIISYVILLVPQDYQLDWNNLIAEAGNEELANFLRSMAQ